MPSGKKTIYFLSSAVVTSIAVGVLGYGLSTDWAEINMDCARADSDLFNGTAQVLYKFFNGYISRTQCPSFGNQLTFEGNTLILLSLKF